MMDASDIAWIRREIATALQIILSGATAATQVNDVVGTESIDHSPPGMPTIEGRPLAHPYGIVSRAPTGTVQVVAQQGNHPGNRIVLLHRDRNRPSLNAEGEVMLYDKFGNQVWLQDGKIVVKLDDKLELGQGATKGAARNGDTTQISAASDGAFLTWTTAVSTAINGLAPGSVVPPVTITGKINQGSSKVTIVD
jgi:phage gp45-like